MILHWSDSTTLNLEYGVEPKGLGAAVMREEPPYAVTLTFEEMKRLMQDPLYLHYVTYALSGEIPRNYKQEIQR